MLEQKSAELNALTAKQTSPVEQVDYEQENSRLQESNARLTRQIEEEKQSYEDFKNKIVMVIEENENL